MDAGRAGGPYDHQRSTLVGSTPSTGGVAPSPGTSGGHPAAAVETTRRPHGRRVPLLAVATVVVLLAAAAVFVATAVSRHTTAGPLHSVGTIPLTYLDGRISQSRDGNTLIVDNSDGVDIIDVDAPQTTRHIPVRGRNAAGGLFGGSNTYTYYGGLNPPDSANPDGVNFVGRINLSTGQVEAIDALDSQPDGVAESPGGLFVSTKSGVRFVDISTRISTGVDTKPGRLFLSRTERTLYRFEAGSLSTIDVTTRTVTKTLPLLLNDNIINDVELSPDEQSLILAQSQGISIVRISTGQVMRWMPLDEIPYNIALTPDGNAAYASNELSDQVQKISLTDGSVIATVPVGDEPRQIALSPDGRRLFVVDSGSRDVSIIATTP
jgi:YVTN family beta-propeller protein